MQSFDKQVVVGQESKRPIVVRQSEFENNRGIDVRRFFYTEENELRPTKKGIWLKTDQWQDVLAAVKDLLVQSN